MEPASHQGLSVETTSELRLRISRRLSRMMRRRIIRRRRRNRSSATTAPTTATTTERRVVEAHPRRRNNSSNNNNRSYRGHGVGIIAVRRRRTRRRLQRLQLTTRLIEWLRMHNSRLYRNNPTSNGGNNYREWIWLDRLLQNWIWSNEELHSNMLSPPLSGYELLFLGSLYKVMFMHLHFLTFFSPFEIFSGLLQVTTCIAREINPNHHLGSKPISGPDHLLHCRHIGNPFERRLCLFCRGLWWGNTCHVSGLLLA